MAKGDHIYVYLRYRSLVPFRHHGIDMGDGTVVHYSSGLPIGHLVSETERLSRMEIRRTSTELFSEGQKVRTCKHHDAADSELVCQRALSKLGSRDYSLANNNCEHFACWCKTGRWESDQVHSVRESLQTATSSVTKLGMALAVRHSSLSRVVLSRVAATAVQGAVKFHPGYLAGDAVDAVARCAAKRRGVETEKAQQIGRWAGSSTVAAVGFVIGGPAGAAGAVSLHCVTQKIADKVIAWAETDCLRKTASPTADAPTDSAILNAVPAIAPTS